MNFFIKILLFVIFNLNFISISISFSSQVEKIRDAANSKPFVIENKTASQLANDFLAEAGVTEGWNEDNNFFISKASSYFAINDLVNNNFLNIRAIKAFEANLTAKSDIISFIKTSLTSKDSIKTQTSESNVKEENKSSQQNTSLIKTFSSMPLTGAFQIAHFESFIDGQYEITVILMWSQKHEKRVYALLNGENISLEPSTTSLKDYIKNTNWASVVGGRKFIDDKGNFYLVGVGSTPINGKNSAQMKTSKGKSELIALKEIGITLKGDIELNRLAKEKLSEVTNKDGSSTNETSSSFAESLYQRLEGLKITGTSKRYSDVLKHPLSGQEMYVTVLSLSLNNKSVPPIHKKIVNLVVKANNSKNNSSTTPTLINSSRTNLTVVSTSVQGVGTDSKEAIKDGLLQAISQVNGLQMSSQSKSMLKSFQSSSDNNDKFESSSSFQEEIKQSTKGVIQSWSIVSKDKTSSGKLYTVDMKVDVSKLKLSDELQRMRFVITPTIIDKTIKDKKNVNNFTLNFNKNLSSLITQSNRFAVLDRNNTSSISKELNNIKSGKVPKEELAKLGNKVSADYLILSSLNKILIKNISKSLMGEKIYIKNITVDVDVNIIDVSTSQIIFSDNLSLTQSGGTLATMSKIMSERVSRKIIDRFYPAKLIAIDNKKIIVDQGDSFFNSKNKYKLIKLGNRIIDQTTSLVSGRVEEEIGTLIFLSGSPKQSILKIDKVNIDISKLIPDGSFIVRPIFKKLPTEDEIAKEKIKNIKNKSKNMMKKIEKDKDW